MKMHLKTLYKTLKNIFCVRLKIELTFLLAALSDEPRGRFGRDEDGENDEEIHPIHQSAQTSPLGNTVTVVGRKEWKLVLLFGVVDVIIIVVDLSLSSFLSS